MAMRVAIVDDEEAVREELADYLQRFSAESGVKLEVVPFSSGDVFLNHYSPVYNIIIFDIDMPGTNGMDVARQVRAKDRSVTIMFMTNIAQYAIAGYEVDAVDYILKPIGYYDFSMKFYRTVAKAAQKIEHIVRIETAEGVRRIHVKKIVYVEILSHYLHIHVEEDADDRKATAGDRKRTSAAGTAAGKSPNAAEGGSPQAPGDRVYVTRGNMQTAAEILGKYGFVQCHRSYMVNLEFVDRVLSTEVVLKDVTLPVGRAYRDELRRRYMLYVSGSEDESIAD